jgi:prepilin-type N-terminal cleavage/methylation domain-containing protein
VNRMRSPRRLQPLPGRRAFTLTELVVTITVSGILTAVGYAAYDAVVNNDRDAAAEAQLAQVAKMATGDFVAARNWNDAFIGATEEAGFKALVDAPAAPKPSAVPGEVSYRAVGKRVGMAMRTVRDTCVMGVIDNRAVEVWTVEEDLGEFCAGRLAFLGNQPAAAYGAGDTTLSAPTDLVAVGGRRRVVLSWQGAGVSFRVLRDGSEIATATSPFTDTTVAGGRSYNYEVVALDAAGRESSSVGPVSALTIPDAPSGLAVSPGAAGRIEASWNASAGTVTSYKVYDEEGVVVWQGSQTTMSYESAAAPTALKVTASNATGESLQSPEVLLVASLTAPRDLVGTGSDRAASLTWAAPASGRASGYEVLRDGAVVARTSATSAIVSGLRNGTAYSFSVRAYNASGNSPASAAVLVTPGTNPDGATGMTTTQCANNDPEALRLSWTAPADDPDNPLQGFRVFETGTSTLVAEIRMPLTTATITNLAPGSTYSFDIKTWRTGGISSTVTTTATVAGCRPVPPVAPRVTVIPPSSATGSYSLAPTARPAIDFYEYRCTSANGGAPVTAASSSGSATSLGIEGLTAGKTYSCMAYSRNAVGYSIGVIAVPANNASPTNPQESFDTILPPNTPASPTMSGGNGSMTVSWAAVASSASRPVSGYRVFLLPDRPSKCTGSVTCMPPITGSARCTTSTTSCVLSGLTNGTTYTAYLQSYNLAFYSDGPNASYLVYGPPPSPTLSAGSGTSSSLALSASATSTTANPVSGYYFYRSGSLIATTSGSHTDTGLAAGTSYCYTTVAYNGLYVSSASAQQCAQTVPNPPPAPTSSGWTTSGFSLSWSAVGGATSYEYHLTAIGTYPATAATSASLSSLSSCTWYTAHVRANGPWGTTAWSASTSIQTRCALSIVDTFDAVQGYAGTGRWPSSSPYVQTASSPNPTRYMTFGYDQFCTTCSSIKHYSVGLYFTGAPTTASYPNLRNVSCQARVWPTGSRYSTAFSWARATGNGLVEFHFLKYSSLASMRSGSRPAVGRGVQVTGSVSSGTVYTATLSSNQCTSFLNGSLNGFLIGPYTNTSGTPIDDAHSNGVSFAGRLALADEGGNSRPQMLYTGSYGGSG